VVVFPGRCQVLSVYFFKFFSAILSANMLTVCAGNTTDTIFPSLLSLCPTVDIIGAMVMVSSVQYCVQQLCTVQCTHI